MPLQPTGFESCGEFCWKQCKAMSRQDAMANADEAVPAIGGRAEDDEARDDLHELRCGAPPKAAPAAGGQEEPPPAIARIAISHSLIWVPQPYY